MKREKTNQVLLHIFFIVLSVLMLIPFLIMISSSFTADDYLKTNGYQLIPLQPSLDAYTYLLRNVGDIGKAYVTTIGVAAVGTVLSLVITVLFAYPLSLPNMPGRKIIMFALIFAMLFNGGMVPTYIMYSQGLHIRNTYWALLIPSLLMSAFNVILVRNYFVTSIPRELMESAKLDGASEIKTLTRIVLPLSTPILATVGIMQVLAYWNDWFNGLLYLTDGSITTIQIYLNDILRNVQFLSHSNLTSGMVVQMEMPEVSIRMAIAVIAVLPILVIYPFVQKLFVKGISAGAVKG